jgi:splicing factor U2AF subunit
MKQNPTMSMTDIMTQMAPGSAPLISPAAMSAAGSMGAMMGGAGVMNAAATKTMRELYVGGLVSGATAPQLQEFLCATMVQMGMATAPGPSVLNTWLSSDNNYAFCEFRSIEEANNGMMLTNVNFMGQPLKVGRPKNYDGPDITPLPGGSAMMGMPMAMPGMPGAASASETLMLMNIPDFLAEAQVMELLNPFGTLKTFNLMKTEEGKSLGSAVFEFSDSTQTQNALTGLNGLDIGSKKLRIIRAPATPGMTLSAVKSEEQVAKDKEEEEAQAKLDASKSEVLRLKNMVTADSEELRDDEEYTELCIDVREECERYGSVVRLEIPRPTEEAKLDGVGFIFVQFGEMAAAIEAQDKLDGRSFGGNTVEASFFPLAHFSSDIFDDTQEIPQAAKDAAAAAAAAAEATVATPASPPAAAPIADAPTAAITDGAATADAATADAATMDAATMDAAPAPVGAGAVEADLD